MKQRLEKYSERFDNKDNELTEGIFNPDTWGKRVVEKHIDILDMGQIPPKEEHKQETLEEAAEIFDYTLGVEYCAFIEGAKWQQEQIGKSEFLQRLRATKSDAEARRLIFEQFK